MEHCILQKTPSRLTLGITKNNDFRDNFSPSENSIEEYYNNNKKLFINPEERSFKQFNFKSKEEADEFKLSVSGKTNEEIIKYAEKNNIIFNEFKNVDRNKDGLVSINDILIEEGHAYDYHGGKKKDFKAEAKKEIEAEKAGKSADLVDKPAEEKASES